MEPPPPPPAPKRPPSPPLVEPEDSEVTVLTKDTFEQFIFDNEYAVVEFYAPWCGKCSAKVTKNVSVHADALTCQTYIDTLMASCFVRFLASFGKTVPADGGNGGS